MGLLSWLPGRKRNPTPTDTTAPRKWLPVIDADYCMGCGKCVEHCPNGSLELVWAFATVKHPDRCQSQGDCVDHCCDGLIRMDWVPLPDGDQSIGQWRDPGETRTDEE